MLGQCLLHHRDPNWAKPGWCPGKSVGPQCTHPQAWIFGLGPRAFTVCTLHLNDILSMCYRECTQTKHKHQMSTPSLQLQGHSTIPTSLPSASIAFILTLVSIPKHSTTFQCVIYPIWTHFSTLLSNTFMFVLSIPQAGAPVQIIGILLIFQTMIMQVV